MSLFNVYISNIGLEILYLWMECYSENVFVVVKWFVNYECIEWVNYLGLDSNENYLLV